MELYISRGARSDMLSIYNYLAARSPAAAERTVTRLTERFEELLVHPFLGPDRSDIRPYLRGLLIDRYVALYVPEPSHIVIVRVLDSRMNIERAFFQ